MKDNKNSFLGPLLLIGVLFFIFGFVTWVNGTLITFFKNAFGLSNQSSFLVTFAFFISYFFMAIPASAVLRKTGFKKGMSLGLFVMAIGTAIFIPAANIVSYPLFLIGLFTISIGLTVLQTASNPYVTILGPRDSAAQRISFMGVANKFGGIISQKLFGSALLAGTIAGAVIDPKIELQKVVNPYLILTGVLVLLSILILYTKGLPEVSDEQAGEDGKTVDGQQSAFQHANLVLGCIALFCCVGIEVICADSIINYGQELGFTSDKAKDFGTYTLWFMLLGYFMGIFLIPKIISQQKFLTLASIFGVLVSILVVYTSGISSIICVAVLGVSNAILWPAIWPLSLDGLGKHTKLGSALLIMMIAGGALLPLVYGALADSFGGQKAYLFLVPLYCVILYFATLGHKKKTW